MNFRRLLFPRRLRCQVWRMLADLTGTGMELGRALDLARKCLGSRAPGADRVLSDLRRSLASGRFGEMARRHAPESEALVFSRFGATSDADLFRAAARIAEAEAEIAKAIASAVLRPAFLLLLTAILLFFLGRDFYPTLMLVSPMEDWPRDWRVTASVALVVSGHPYALLAGLAALYGAYRLVLTTYVGPFRRQLDKIPPFSLHRLAVGATFAFVIVENARVGQSINSGLMRALARNASPYARSRIGAIESNISFMNVGAAAVAAGMDFPDPELNAVLAAYAERENWAESFGSYAEAWLSRLEARVKAAVAALNVLLMTLTAAFIAQVGRTIFGIVGAIG